MEFIGFLGAALLLALALLPRCLPAGDSTDSGARWAAVFLLWFGILVALNWALAAVHLLTAGGFRIAGGLCALWGAAQLVRYRRRSFRSWVGQLREAGGVLGSLDARLRRMPRLMALALALVLLSLLYVLARSLILGVNVVEFDALSYHFPKAVEICRAHTIPAIHCGDFRLSYFPWDYELLLADGFLLTPGDWLCFLVPLLSYGGFAAVVYAISRQFWPRTHRDDHVLGVILALATPILILHITANKNDVLTAFFQLEFVLWSTLWYLGRSPRQGVLAIISLGLCFGTKTSALFLGPWLVVMLWRRRRMFTPSALGGTGRALTAGAVILAGLAALGAAWPLLNLAWTGRWLGIVSKAGGISSFEANAAPHYNGISNLWRFPLLVFLKPFAGNDLEVWVPWQGRYWFWPTYRTIYGHFGWLCTALLTVLPFGIRRHRSAQREAAGFRLWAAASMVSFTLFTLPQQYRVDGMFCGAARYLLCIPVLVLLWSAVPLFSWLREHQKVFLHTLLGFGALAYFGAQSWIYFGRDEARPVAEVLDRLGQQGPPVSGTVAEGLDAHAGPHDTIALDGGFGALFYPIYGARQQRPVSFLVPTQGPVAIPDQAKWVLIDRSWNAGWSHPGITTTADFRLPIKPRITEEDYTVFRQLSKDPDWRLVYLNPRRMEAVFQRKAPVAP